MDLDAIFDAKDTPAAPPEPQPAETPAPQPEPQAPEPEPEAPPPPAAPQPEPERTAPLTALLDERDKRKAAERERDELRAQRQQPAAAIPDPYDNPEGYQAHVEQIVANQTLNLKFELSESMARDKHGDDVVQKAMEWGAQQAQSNPGFRSEFLAAKNPIDWVVRQQRRDGLLSEVGDDPDAYVRRRAAELGLIAAPDAGAGVVPVQVQQQAPRPAAPPRSIASVAGAGGGPRDLPTGPLAGLASVFKG